MIEIKGVTKKFGDLTVLDNIDLKINDGEIYGLVGKSGAGKSTLLRCINGLESYSTGSIRVDDVEVKDLNRKALRNYRKNVAMIFQHFPMLSRKTVYENIAFPMKCWRYDKRYVDQKVKELADIISGIILAMVSILGCTAMAGAMGAGGIGNVALIYGYQKFNEPVMILCAGILVVFVEIIEIVGRWVYRKLK